MSEAALVRQLLSYLRALPRTCARKVHGGPHQGAGEPDIDAVVDGRAVKVEAKVPGRAGTVTPLQRQVLGEWDRAGATVGVVTTVEELAALLGTPCPADSNGDGDCGRALCPCADPDATRARIRARWTTD